MTVLVTGGAGYIGSHVVNLLLDRGDSVVIVDDLVTGVQERVAGVPLTQIDMSVSEAPDVLEKIMRDNDVDAVIHFAGRKQVAESVARPAWYYQQNVGSLANLLLAMESAAVKRLVFSSSAAVYGSSEGASLQEDTPPRPINPYGESKLIGEWLVADAVTSFGLRASSLRYFNVAGAGRPELGDTAVLNLVPMVLERLDRGLSPLIFGADYDTDDGTCVRDYIHVLDLADAHLSTLDSLTEGDPRHDVFNVGTGIGSSVRAMVDEIVRVSGSEALPEVLGRRPGDPATVVADPRLIFDTVGWTATRGLTEIVQSAWDSHLFLTR
ncbi:UDP-glucose 4-epimerase GalE [Cryobacterium frigoriphilum]|uniref:UDP-glucose 4-epimerase n=1 Tax=Cryobacterium frigoriphilum TaxID=1259150 RepID=A0A4V3IRE1_9MICO|nr:UDP-glucose 4-epimerase GalE [Cryobacterium frigoriphilum]TFD50810.1 UDP-glucose 4-epimerase GalE [Cryobacterium frigoriphilum]